MEDDAASLVPKRLLAVPLVCLDTETDFGSTDPKSGRSARTTQIGLYCEESGLSVRLSCSNGFISSSAGLWATAIAFLHQYFCNIEQEQQPLTRQRSWDVLLVAHNGFAFDYMNCLTELMHAPRANGEAMTWFKERVGFIDSLEVMQKEILANNEVVLRSLNLDSLYAHFVGGASAQSVHHAGGMPQIIPGRHDALEDAKALYSVLRSAGMLNADLLSKFALMRGWNDLQVIYRVWSVREGILKNPSRPCPVPRIFPLASPEPAKCLTSIRLQKHQQKFAVAPPLDARWKITLSKQNEQTAYWATVKRLPDDTSLYDIKGKVEGRFLGLPGRLRAWSQILRCLRTPSDCTPASHGDIAPHPKIIQSPYGVRQSAHHVPPPATQQQDNSTDKGEPQEGVLVVPSGLSLQIVDTDALRMRQGMEALSSADSEPNAGGLPVNSKDALIELQGVCAQLESIGIKLTWHQECAP